MVEDLRDKFRANGGTWPTGREGRRGWPGYAPSIQPGNAPLPGEDTREARVPIAAPPNGRFFDPRLFGDHALASALGLQWALEDPHTRMLMQTLIDNVARATFKPMVFPPWIYKPFNGLDFGGNVSMTALAAGNPWTTFTDGVTTLSFTMPDGYMGVVKEFGQGAQSATDWDSLCWRLVKSGQPLTPWDNVCCQAGMFQSPRQVQIILRPGEKIELQVKNSSVANILFVSGWLYGWMWQTPDPGNTFNAHGQASVA